MATPTPRKSARSRKQPLQATQPASSASLPGHAVIAKRAYELFLQRGGVHGRDWEDWLTAERELLPSGNGAMNGDLAHQ
jgi:DUF2934 family protein